MCGCNVKNKNLGILLHQCLGVSILFGISHSYTFCPLLTGLPKGTSFFQQSDTFLLFIIEPLNGSASIMFHHVK